MIKYIFNIIKYTIAIIFLFLITYMQISSFLYYYTRYNNFIKTPNLIGINIFNVDKSIKDNIKLKIGYTFVDNKPENIIINQYPLPYSDIKNKRQIYVNVTAPKPLYVIIPELCNMTKRDVINILSQYNINIRKIVYIQSNQKDILLYAKHENSIINFNKPIYIKNTIDLYFGNGLGNNTVEIPNLKGLTLAEAIKIIIDKNLTIGLITYTKKVNDKNNAIIYKQKSSFKPINDKVLFGTPINIYLDKE